MMNRREMISIGAGAAIAAACRKRGPRPTISSSRAGASSIPRSGSTRIRDVAIAAAGSRRSRPSIAGDATETIDARGKIVAPGLIDIHTHAGRGKEGRRWRCRTA